jgi:hypothetical protein
MIRRTALVAFLFVLVGCDSEGPLDVQPEPLLPLEVGTAWVFDYDRSFGPEVPASTDTLRVVGETVLDGVRWAELRSASSSLDLYLGGFYSLIEGEVWYSPDLTEAPPYRLFALDPAYTIRSSFYDADVVLDQSGDEYVYTFDFLRIRNPFIPGTGELPVGAGSPTLLRTLEVGSGFTRYDDAIFFPIGADSTNVFAVDTYTRRAFLPAE